MPSRNGCHWRKARTRVITPAMVSAPARPYFAKVLANPNRIRPDAFAKSGRRAKLASWRDRTVLTDGSRTTFATGMACILAARDAIKKLCARAAATWGIPEDAVTWEKGYAKPAGANAGNFPPLSLKEIAAASPGTGGPIAGHHEYSADGAGVSFATHICDVETDPETGRSQIVRYTVIQDAGKAVHPSYVEGQFQGGAVQGIGWALNEEYIYGKDGRLQNAGFLDYRIPVCSDLPMIDTQILEIPNPGHPYGVRGVGETSIVPPLAAIANAVAAATGVRFTQIPLSPPRVLKGIEEARKVKAPKAA